MNEAMHYLTVCGLLLFIITLISFLITTYNLFTAPKINIGETLKKNKTKIPKNDILVSILIPARNEEKNIEKALLSSINQTLQEIEIIVLDDNSVDNTSNLVRQIISTYKNKKIKLISGSPLPMNWNGKSWACFNLYKASKGNYLLFIDADVCLDKYAVEIALNKMIKNKLDLLTIIPNQITLHLGESILVNVFMEWFVTTFLPIKLSNSLNKNPLTAACGQFMLFKRDSYVSIRGHSCVGPNIVEEREIAIKMREKKFKVGLFLTNNLVHCKMYENFKAAFNGFSNTFFPGSKLNPILFMILTIIIFLSQTLPFIFYKLHHYFFIGAVLIIIQEILHSLIFKKHFYTNLILHPVKMLFFLQAATLSCIKTLKGNIEWKGRKVIQKIN